MQVLPANQLWINPDCGLKTRTWEQVIPALRTMTAAAQQARTSLVTGQSQQVNDVKP